MPSAKTKRRPVTKPVARKTTLKKAAPTLVPVVVTTEKKGVFFGYLPQAKPSKEKTVDLQKARMCVYWSSNVRGVLGLASTGPKSGCKISPAVPAIHLDGVTSVMTCSTEAAAAWESAPWA